MRDVELREKQQTLCRERPGAEILGTPGIVSIASQRASPGQKLWMLKFDLLVVTSGAFQSL